MKRDNKKSVILRPYAEALPDILNYQIVTKAIICIWLFLLGRIFQVLLRSSGRVAVTSGDWNFFLRPGRAYLFCCSGWRRFSFMWHSTSTQR